MKKALIILLYIAFQQTSVFSQYFSACENVSAFDRNSTPDIGIVISTDDPETAWNALRLGIAAQSKGDTVVIFVIGRATDIFIKDTSKFDLPKAKLDFVKNGGNIYTCATCAKMRHTENVELCTITSIYDLYEIIKKSRKVVTF